MATLIRYNRDLRMDKVEPPRVFRGLGYVSTATPPGAAWQSWYACSNWPVARSRGARAGAGSCTRRPTRASRTRRPRVLSQGPRRRISSVLNKPITVSARALSYESPALPTDRSMRSYNRLTPAVLRRPVELGLPAAVAVMHQRRGPGPVVAHLFQGIERQVAAQRTRHVPPDDPPGEHVDPT